MNEYFCPAVEGGLSVPLIEQIVGILVINFNEWDLKLIHVFLIPSTKLLEDISENSRNDSSILPIIPSTHGKCFPWTSLPICEYGPIISIKAVINNWFRYFLKEFLLVGSIRKDAVECEWVGVLGIGKFASRNLQLEGIVG